jgi:APA family basic amino acid/polyamine antiporter
MVGDMTTQSQDQKKKAKGIGLFNIVMAGLSGAIGFEIFVLLDYAYFHLAGPDMLVALALGGLINLLIMLSYCELSAAMPIVGGEYTYIKTAYGGYVSFIFGCFRWLASIFAASLAAVAFVLQFSYLFSAVSPQIQTGILNQSWIIAAVLVVVMGVLEVRGSRKIGNLVVIAFILLFAGFIVGGFIRGLGSVQLVGAPLPSGVSGIFAAVVFVFPMFIGTRAISASAPESRNPAKDIPRGFLFSALIIIPLYILLAFVAVGSKPPSDILGKIPLLSFAAGKLFGSFGSVIFSLAGMAACLSALGTSLSVQSSIARGMSRDGYFPKILLAVHSRYGTYHVAAIVGTIFIMFLSTLGAVPFLGYAASFGSLLVFAVVNLSLMRLRKTKPYMDRPFKTPLYPFTPIFSIILSVALLFIPVAIGDGNAVDALTSSVALTGIVLVSYYLRMAGRYRAQVALGGIGIGVGVLTGLVALLNVGGLAMSILPFVPSYVQLVFSVVLIVTGYFNLESGAKKRIIQTGENRQDSSKGLRDRLAERLKLAV